MPLEAFITMSVNYLKNVCSCSKDDILIIWCIHEGSFHYRAQFLIQSDRRVFEIAYQDLGQIFTICEIDIKNRKDISRRDMTNDRF